MTAPSKKCEICGEDVTNLTYKKHVAAHTESEREQIKEPIVKSIPKEPVQDKQKVAPEVAALLELAVAAEEKMLDAPDLFFGEDSADQHGSLVKVHCPESLGENAEWTSVFGDAKKRLDGYAAKGYRPISDGKGNIVTDDQGNPMFKVRKKIFEGRKDVYRKESEANLHQVTRRVKDKSPNSHFSEEELTIEKHTGDRK